MCNVRDVGQVRTVRKVRKVRKVHACETGESDYRVRVAQAILVNCRKIRRLVDVAA